jgi:gamma-glutamyl-gamma-aminobutyrate hydrolase PuuD
MLVALILLLLGAVQKTEGVVQEKIIMILSSQRPLKNSKVAETHDDENNKTAKFKTEFYVYENYTKYIDLLGEGYKYMLVPYIVEDDLFNKLLSISSGVLLPGGSDEFYNLDEQEKPDINNPTQLLNKIELVYLHATKQKNIEQGFAVFGICLGMEGFMIAAFREMNKK